MKIKLGTLVFLVCTSLLGCSEQSQENSKPVVKVNDYTISEDALRSRMASLSYYRGMSAFSLDDKKNLVDQEIKKELLIQEAMRLGLDKDDSFRKTIEKFWEQTLITEVVKQQLEKIQKNTIVTSDEVANAYKEMQDNNPNCPPLETVAGSLEKSILEQKKTEALSTWTDDLRKNAKIIVYDDNLASMK